MNTGLEGGLLLGASFLIPLGAIVAAVLTAIGYFKRNLGVLWLPAAVCFLAPWFLTLSQKDGFTAMIDIAFSGQQSNLVGPVWVSPLSGVGIVFAIGAYRMRSMREALTAKREPRVSKN